MKWTPICIWEWLGSVFRFTNRLINPKLGFNSGYYINCFMYNTNYKQLNMVLKQCWFTSPPRSCSNDILCIGTGISQLSSSPALPFVFYTFGIPSLNRVEAWVSTLESPISSSNTSDWIMFSDGTVDLQQVSRILFSRQIVQYKHWYTIIKLPIDGEYMYHL